MLNLSNLTHRFGIHRRQHASSEPAHAATSVPPVNQAPANLAAELELAETETLPFNASDTLTRTQGQPHSNTPSEAIESIDKTISQLEWLKNTIQRLPDAGSVYANGLQSIVETINHCLPFFSDSDSKPIVRSDKEHKAALTVIQMERDIAQDELQKVLQENRSLVDALNSERKQLLAAMPAYILALETADALYQVVHDQIESCKLLDTKIGAPEVSEGALIETNTVNDLRRSGIITYRQLIKLTKKEILAIPGIGPVSHQKIQAELARLDIPTLEGILTANSPFIAPILYDGGRSDTLTFTRENMRWISSEVRSFDGWQVPKAISAVSRHDETIEVSGCQIPNRHFFGGIDRDFRRPGVSSRIYVGKQYNYHFLSLTPLSEMLAKARYQPVCTLDDLEEIDDPFEEPNLLDNYN